MISRPSSTSPQEVSNHDMSLSGTLRSVLRAVSKSRRKAWRFRKGRLGVQKPWAQKQGKQMENHGKPMDNWEFPWDSWKIFTGIRMDFGWDNGCFDGQKWGKMTT